MGALSISSASPAGQSEEPEVPREALACANVDRKQILPIQQAQLTAIQEIGDKVGEIISKGGSGFLCRTFIQHSKGMWHAQCVADATFDILALSGDIPRTKANVQTYGESVIVFQAENNQLRMISVPQSRTVACPGKKDGKMGNHVISTNRLGTLTPSVSYNFLETTPSHEPSERKPKKELVTL